MVEASREVPAIAVVGLPLRVDHRLFNCAAVVCGGRVLGVVPKTYLPNYGEFYEARQFASGAGVVTAEIDLLGQRVPFGTDLLFQSPSIRNFTLHVEICEDVWVPIPPSTYAALAGATVLVNLSASNITIGKSDYRHRLVSLQSARCLAAYLYSSAGIGESTTDLAWDGQALIYENGDLLAESPRFGVGAHFITADVDLERVSRERMRQNTFGQSVERHRDELLGFRHVRFEPPAAPAASLPLQRRVDASPTCRPTAPSATSAARRSTTSRCRPWCSGCRRAASSKVVIGVSGGLDSTHALLVVAARWTGSACRAATSSATRCRASRPARARSTRRGG